MKSIEIKGKSIENALNNGMKELGVETLENVEVEILKHPGVFSQGLVKLSLMTHGNDRLDSTTPREILNRIEKRAKNSKFESKNNNDRQNGKQQNVANVNNGEVKQNPNQKNREQVKQINQQKPAQNPNQQKPIQNANQQKPAQNANQQKPAQNANQQKPAQNNAKQNNQQPAREKHIQKPAIVVSPAVMQEAKEKIDIYMTALLQKAGANDKFESKIDGDGLYYVLDKECEFLIGYRGESLDSIEYLAMQSASEDNKIKVFVDCNGYRDKRNAELIQLAKNKADEAIRKNKKIRLDNMNSLSRKIIHSALSENTEVITKSEGREPNRYLVVMPKTMIAEGGSRNDNHHNRNRNKSKKNYNNNNNKQS